MGLRPAAPGAHALGHGEAVHEARAGGVQVEGDGVLEAEAATQQTGGGGHGHVGRDGGEDDEVDGGRVDGRPLAPTARVEAERLTRGGFGQVGCGFLNGHVTGSDTRARADPLVVRVHQCFQVVVGHLELRE